MVKIILKNALSKFKKKVMKGNKKINLKCMNQGKNQL